MFKHSQEIKHQYQIIMMQYVVMNTRWGRWCRSLFFCWQTDLLSLIWSWLT